MRSFAYAMRLAILHNTRLNAGALNWATGETVAVADKEMIEMANIPKSELGEIMVSIDCMRSVPALLTLLL